MRDYQLKELVSLADAASLLPERAGKAISPATLRSWVRTGIRDTRLRVEIVGGTAFTTERWLFEFIDALGQDR